MNVISVVGVIIMLIHESGIACPKIWEQWCTELESCGIVLRVHLKAGIICDEHLNGYKFIVSRLLQTRILSKWGDISLLQTELQCAKEVFDTYRRCQFVSYCSGTCLPTISPRQLPLLNRTRLAMLRQPEYNLSPTQTRHLMLALKHHFKTDIQNIVCWKQAFTFHHQWLILSRQHFQMIWKQQKDIMSTIQYLHDQTECNWSPDEYGIATSLFVAGTRLNQLEEMNNNIDWEYTTHVLVKNSHAQHPLEWNNLLSTQVYLSENGTSVEAGLKAALYQSKNNHCWFFRKVIPSTIYDEHSILQFLINEIWI
jgi:hypothetical protein